MKPDTTNLRPSASKAEESIERASDSLALLGATLCGIMSSGDGLTPPEAHGALILLEVVQADLDSARAVMQALTSQAAHSAAA